MPLTISSGATAMTFLINQLITNITNTSTTGLIYII